LEILPHPPYSPDLASSDYYFFRSPSNNLHEIPFNNDAEFQNWLDEFFTAKPADFFKREIDNMPERWEAVLNIEDGYIID
jgi:hypothetical protein